MPETQTTPPTPAVSPVENVEKWLGDKVDALAGAPASETPAAPPPSTWKDAVLDGDDVPENFRGKRTPDLLKSWQHAQEAVRNMQSERDRARGEAEALRLQQAAEAAVARALPKPEPQAPVVDPRAEQLQDLWMRGDYAGWQQLQDSMLQERLTKELSAAEERAAQKAIEVFQGNQAKGNQNAAYTAAMTHLTSLGVQPTPEQLMAVYVNLTHPNNKYRAYGGPEHPSNVVAQFKDLFGLPEPAPAAAAPAPAAPTPQAQRPAVVAPPGANKPAAVVAPVTDTSSPLRREMRDAAEAVATELGLNKERFMGRFKGAKGANANA